MKLTLKKKHYLILLAAFAVSILFRLPNLDRPLSKHHEFNTAVILNGITSWKEGGGASRFGYVPLMTYQGEANRMLKPGPYSDSIGNAYYLSLGAGWYILPYLVFTALHMPSIPLSIQLLNLLIHLLVVLSIYRLGRTTTLQYNLLSPHFPLYTALIFLFLSGPLWFYGNGYVHDAVSLPFAICLFNLYLQFVFRQKKMNGPNLAIFALWGFAGIYFDWFTFFLLGIISCYSLYLFSKNKEKNWLLLGLFGGCVAVAAVGLVFLQYASYFSAKQVIEYWTNRAAARTLVYEDNYIIHLFAFFRNIVSSIGITAICLGLVFLFIRKKGFPMLPLLLWLTTCFFYNCILFDWSYNHDFSMVPLGVGISIATAYIILQVRSYKVAGLLLTALCMLNVVQYYFINPPGKFSKTGEPYNQQQLLGIEIKKRIPADVRIFSNSVNDPMTEYYAHRSFVFNKVASAAEAKKMSDSLHVPKAAWMLIDSFKIKEIQFLR